jgi:response regulator NasT
MENALIVSSSEKETTLFTGFLSAASIHQVTSSMSCDSARRLMLKQDFDLIIVDSPLQDESGENFSRQAAARGICQVILLVESGSFDSISAACEDDGVLVIAKPADKSLLWSALSLVKSVQNRVKRMRTENIQLKQKIEDLRIIDRAKWILISSMKMSEQEAHRYIEKQAMDMRLSRRVIAEEILKRYEN